MMIISNRKMEPSTHFVTYEHGALEWEDPGAGVMCYMLAAFDGTRGICQLSFVWAPVMDLESLWENIISLSVYQLVRATKRFFEI